MFSKKKLKKASTRLETGLSIMVAIIAVLGISSIGFSQEIMTTDEHNHNDHAPFSLSALVRPLGISALSSLLITFLTGLFRKKLGRRFLKIHKVFAFTTVLIAVSHGIMVLVLF